LAAVSLDQSGWSFTMRFIGYVAGYVALAVASIVGPDLASAQQKGTAPPGATAERQAPVGHRQPQAKDAPSEHQGGDGVRAEDREMEKALKGICRGC
jgi:hypothetical protein